MMTGGFASPVLEVIFKVTVTFPPESDIWLGEIVPESRLGGVESNPLAGVMIRVMRPRATNRDRVRRIRILVSIPEE
jgi:hypothetical protein